MKKFLIGAGALVLVGAAVGVYLYKKAEEEFDNLDINNMDEDDDLDFFDEDIEHDSENTTSDGSVQVPVETPDTPSETAE